MSDSAGLDDRRRHTVTTPVVLLGLLLLGLLLAACGGAAPRVELSEAGKQVKVASVPPPAGGKKLGQVEAVHGGGCGSIGMKGKRASALALLRNEAAALGARYVHITRSVQPEQTGQCPDNRWILKGVAYK